MRPPVVLLTIASMFMAGAGTASAAQSSREVIAEDHAWDDGTRLVVRWTRSEDPGLTHELVARSRTTREMDVLIAQRREAARREVLRSVTKEVLAASGKADPKELDAEGRRELQRRREGALDALVPRAMNEEDRWVLLEAVAPDRKAQIVVSELRPGESYAFRVIAVAGEIAAAPAYSTPEAPTVQGFDGTRLSLAVALALFGGAVVLFIARARRGAELKVRRIAGLEAVDEAIGRATEMGRNVLFVPGGHDLDDIQTIAGLSILSRVARVAAEYDARVEVPTARSLVMTTARETMREAYLAAGRPEAFDDDAVYYVTNEQFGFVAYLTGTMMRERPAACLYMGTFFAESLMLAETGNAIGAIQIAGTANPAQLPFFVAACDYTLIGEEFFAAGAYLSRSPVELGSLKGQDVGKFIVAIMIIVGSLATTLAAASDPQSVTGSWGRAVTKFLQQTVLGGGA